MLEFFQLIKIRQIVSEGRVRQLEEQLSKAIVPKLEIGQRVYMIPNEFNGLNNLTEYEVLDYNLSSLGVRFNLTIINKQKGIEPFYCASEDMIGLSIFSTKEEAESKLKELKGEGENMIKNRCINCPYDKEGNGCVNDACIQEAMLFDVSIDELKGVHKNEKS